MQKKNKNFRDVQQTGERTSSTPISIPQLCDNTNIVCTDEKSISVYLEDQPNFMEKYPGKLCCLCNLSERSCLGQGDFLRVEATEKCEPREADILIGNEKYESRDNCKVDKLLQTIRGRTKNVNKSRLFNNKNVNELETIGQMEPLTLHTLLDGIYFYVHRMCAMWSTGLSRSLTDELPQLEEVVEKSLKIKCNFCGQYGANVTCKMNCDKVYHLPCAAASGSFLLIENLTAFCPDHLHQVPLMCAGTNIDCRYCCDLGDIAKLIMCSTCGDHYHTNCIGLANFPGTRSGWNCQQCSKCQICRQVDSTEGRSVKCEHCQKLYHATCLRPVISSIPKYGWKCNRCRVCTDCGSRTPGAGASSRWHCHYTICDSCYQQRNKGFSCPICHKAYRAAAHKEMVKCSWCNRFVHSSCDEEADLSVYHKKKEINPDYDYYCPLCKFNSFNEKSHITNNQILSIVEYSETLPIPSIPPYDCQYKDSDVDFHEKNYPDYHSTEGKNDVLKISKKRLGFKICPRNRNGKTITQKPGVITQLGRRRGGRSKGRHFIFVSSIDGMGVSDRSSDDDWNMDKKLVLFSAKDTFLLSQDICVMCGSVGIDHDGRLIACTQCGQCYHPYCANIKISLAMLHKGWRCLDCTVCEGCGQKNDEACLILCDECDISYHTYCMIPPLDKVPHGNWKCKYCAVCQKCGRGSPGKNSLWRSGYLECGLCASQKVCCVCMRQYNDNDLIIECSNCERWLHCQCDNINSEKEAELYNSDKYICVLCRPKSKSFTNAISIKIGLKNCSSSRDAYISPLSLNDRLDSGTDRYSIPNVGNNEASELSENVHWLDNVCVNERGLNIIKALSMEIKRKRKMRPTNDTLNKDSGILATIESVVAGSSTTNPEDDGADEITHARQKGDIYKDGMVWQNPENSPPQGFSVSTNDEGVNILRKKRQRNLQKLGIGGFSVRNRTLKKDCDEAGSLVTANNQGPVESEKKKKTVRKKAKTKLSETYPTYLQEAFFGKTLLNSNEIQLSIYESDSSDELNHDGFSVINRGISISPKELHVLNATVPEPNDNFFTSTVKIETDIDILNKLHSLTSKDNMHVTTVALDKITVNQKEISSAVPNHEFLSVTSAGVPSGILSSSLDITSKNICSQLSANNTDSLESIQHVPPRGLDSIMQQPSLPILATGNSINNKEINVESTITESQEQEPNKLFIPVISSEEPIEGFVVGSQKTAEKMRRDEDLGEMATISAVLYANTQHPELKHIYPSWNDRCKQIIKKWRSLSNEKKSPFLQHAKDNRSALRMRKAQQDQQKMSFQHKSLKEQEQERIWKQHQAKAKEAIFSPYSGVNAFGSEGMPLDSKCTNLYSRNCNIPETSQTNFSVNMNTNAVCMPTLCNIDSTEKSNILFAKGVISEEVITDTDNKQLRTLLLKQDFESTWLPDSQNSTQNTLRSNTDIAGSMGGMSLNLKQRNEIKTQLSISNMKIIKTPASGLINKMDFKGRSDSKTTDCSDAIGTDLEKMDHDENVGFGDILGGFGDGDDEDFLKSLTADIGDEFNILEYGDPELDELATSQNLLQKLDFDDTYKNM